MNNSKKVPAKFLASDTVDARVINFAHQHGKEVIVENRELCVITPTRKKITYKYGEVRTQNHFTYKTGVRYQVWLYETTDGSFIAHRLNDGKKAIFEQGQFKKTDIKEVIQVNRKKLRQRVNGAGITILAKA